MRRDREINIFHFSFLDILFNTIGALTFIFLIYAIMTQDLVEERNEAQTILDQKQEEIAKSTRELKSLESEMTKKSEELKTLETQYEEFEKQHEKISAKLKAEQKLKSDKQKTISELRRKIKMSELGMGDQKNVVTSQTEWGEEGGGRMQKIDSFVMQDSNEQWIVSYTDNELCVWDGYQSFSESDIARLSPIIEVSGYPLKSLTEIETSKIDSKIWPKKISGRTIDQYISSLDKKQEAEFSLDVDGDGTLDVYFKGGSLQEGKWKNVYFDVNQDSIPDIGFELNETLSHYTIMQKFFSVENQRFMVRYVDTNEDFVFDEKWVDQQPEDDDYEELYTGFNKASGSWQNKFVDSNGNGVFNEHWIDTKPGNFRYEEKWVDVNQDGIYDEKWEDMIYTDHDFEARFVGWSETHSMFKEAYLDTINSGKWDTHAINTDLNNDQYEMLLKDNDGDGEFEQRLYYDDSSGEYTEASEE